MIRKLTIVFLSCLLMMAHAAHATDVVSAAGAAPSANWSVADLMQMLAQHKSRKATFVEKKYIAALSEPLESSGELTFVAPDRLEKRTLKPKLEAVTLEGDKLILERRNGRKMTLSLSERPEVSGFVESMRATLLGNLAALEQFYALNLDGSVEAWKLSLTPRQPQMLKIISSIHIAGAHDIVETIEFQQADGDRSVMTIKDEGTL